MPILEIQLRPVSLGMPLANTDTILEHSGATSWLGDSALDGKTLLVHEEQGHGDMIMAMRYLPAIVRAAARVSSRSQTISSG